MRLNDDLTDVLREIMNMAIGEATDRLNQVLDREVTIEIPEIVVYTFAEAQEYMKTLAPNDYIHVVQCAEREINLRGILTFPVERQKALVAFLLDGTLEEEMQNLEIDATKEIGNMVIQSLGVMIHSSLGIVLDLELPSVIQSENLLPFHKEELEANVYCAIISFAVESLEINGYLNVILSEEGVQKILEQAFM